MKSFVFFIIFTICLRAQAKWDNNKLVAENLSLPKVTTSSTDLITNSSPLVINAGVVPASCYIRQDQKATKDLFFIYYEISDFKDQFNPESIQVLIDGVPISSFYANIIRTHYIDDTIKTVGANYEMNPPFSTLFKKGSLLSIEDLKTGNVIAKFPLKNSYRSYVNSQAHCNRSAYNKYFLYKKENTYNNMHPYLVPIPDRYAQRLSEKMRLQSGKLWTNSNGYAQYKNQGLWAIVSVPNLDYPSTFYSCSDNIRLIFSINKNNININELGEYNYKLVSSKSNSKNNMEYYGYGEGSSQYFIHLKLPRSTYKNLDPNATYTLKAIDRNNNLIADNQWDTFTLANLPDVLTQIGQECFKKEAQYNVLVIKQQLESFPQDIRHPAENSIFLSRSKERYIKLLSYMKKYLNNTEAYSAVEEAINFYDRHSYNYGDYKFCELVNFDNADSMYESELEDSIACQLEIAEYAAEKGYKVAFDSAKSSISSAVVELKSRNESGFFESALQSLVGAAADVAGYQYGVDLSGVSNSINSYIRDDAYMNKMNKHVFDVNQFAASSTQFANNSSSSSSASAGSMHAAGAKEFNSKISSGNYDCSSEESENQMHYISQRLSQVSGNNMCDASRVTANELKKLRPYYSRCMSDDLAQLNQEISAFEARADGSCVN